MSNAFGSSTSLSEVVLISGLTALAETMFKGDIALTSITIPSTITIIGEEVVIITVILFIISNISITIIVVIIIIIIYSVCKND